MKPYFRTTFILAFGVLFVFSVNAYAVSAFANSGLPCPSYKEKSKWLTCQSDTDCTTVKGICDMNEPSSKKYARKMSKYYSCIAPYADCYIADPNIPRNKSVCRRHVCVFVPSR